MLKVKKQINFWIILLLLNAIIDLVYAFRVYGSATGAQVIEIGFIGLVGLVLAIISYFKQSTTLATISSIITSLISFELIQSIQTFILNQPVF